MGVNDKMLEIMEENRKVLNLVYTDWDENTGNCLPNAFVHYGRELKFWETSNLIRHFIDESRQPQKFAIKKCKLEEVYQNPNQNYYYFIGHCCKDLRDLIWTKDPLSDEIKNCLINCKNFYIGFESEHEADNEGGFTTLLEYIENNNYNAKQFWVINNNGKLDELKRKYNSEINVHSIQFLASSSTIVLSYIGGCEFLPEKEGKFFMLFNKSPKPHRLSLLVLLKKYNLLDQFNWSYVPSYNAQPSRSFYYKMFEQDELDDLHYEMTYFCDLTKKLSDYETEENRFLDDGNLDLSGLPGWMRIPENPRNYVNTYVNVTTESMYDDDLNVIHITEKSTKPFFFYQFPLILASQGHIKKMKEKYGYDFYDDIMDHSYDDEPDQKIRLKKFLKEIQRINDNKEQFIDFYKMNYARFEANKKIVLKNLNDETDYEFLKNLI